MKTNQKIINLMKDAFLKKIKDYVDSSDLSKKALAIKMGLGPNNFSTILRMKNKTSCDRMANILAEIGYNVTFTLQIEKCSTKRKGTVKLIKVLK
jgi:epoxyqueuosine reductase QueG